MDRATLEQDAPPGAGIVPMSLGGTCPGHRIERGPKRGLIPAFCANSCGAFDPAGTLKPAAVRLPPAMEWGCVNWRAHGGGTVPPRVDGVKALPRGGGDADSTRAGEGG